jgi:tetratricopeptide (TPR) repeat protein
MVNALEYQQSGRLAGAERICWQILAIDPGHADSMHLLGVINYQSGRYGVACEMIGKALAINNKIASYHSNLGTVLMAQGKLDHAATCYERALALKSHFATAHLNLGGVLHAQGKFDEAAARCRRALALDPNLAQAHSNLGAVLHAQGKLDEALVCCERAIALCPELAEAHHNLGRLFRTLGRPDEALACISRAIALKPDYAQAHFSESLLLLLRGDFGAGWRNYERRWQSADHNTPPRSYSQPLWRGEAMGSERVLIWGEQGVGDEVMFAGLIPDVLRTDNRCILDCEARLRPLFARSFPQVDVVSGHCVSSASQDQAGELEFAAQLPSGSLPSLFRRSNAEFASTTSPYLFADSVQRERFRANYADGRRVVGLAWQTKSLQSGHIRSIDLSLLAPLFALNGIRWISLQYGSHDALESQAALAEAPIFIDHSVNQLLDIDNFAAQVAAMDMVITIDNSTAHLAGALGIPVWLLLPFASDWRWQERREDSPWYPTMRLFRQPAFGDWQSVVRRIGEALARLDVDIGERSPAR